MQFQVANIMAMKLQPIVKPAHNAMTSFITEFGSYGTNVRIKKVIKTNPHNKTMLVVPKKSLALNSSVRNQLF